MVLCWSYTSNSKGQLPKTITCSPDNLLAIAAAPGSIEAVIRSAVAQFSLTIVIGGTGQDGTKPNAALPCRHFCLEGSHKMQLLLPELSPPSQRKALSSASPEPRRPTINFTAVIAEHHLSLHSSPFPTWCSFTILTSCIGLLHSLHESASKMPLRSLELLSSTSMRIDTCDIPLYSSTPRSLSLHDGPTR